MSRSLVRWIVGAAVAVALPAAAQAQNACTVIGAGNCTVGLATSVTIPQISFLNADQSAVAFSISNLGWTAFLGSAALDTTVVSGVALNVRSNTAYTVALEAGSWSGGGWVVGDLKVDTQAGACAQGDAVTPMVANNALAAFPGSATDGAGLNLCLGLTFPNDLADTRLAPGAYTIPLTLRITAP